MPHEPTSPLRKRSLKKSASGCGRGWNTADSPGTPAADPSEEERPYAYASRSDPNLYIYEYADRLEYYRRMGDEMIHTSTEYKTEDTSRAAR